MHADDAAPAVVGMDRAACPELCLGVSRQNEQGNL